MQASQARFNMQKYISVSPSQLPQDLAEHQNLQSPEERPVTSVSLRKGVVIYCDAAADLLNVSPYASVETPSHEARIHVGGAKYDIPSLVELPVWTQDNDFYCGLQDKSISIHHPNQFASAKNTTAQSLFASGNLNDPAFGTAPIPMGNVCVFRSDGLELLPQHLEALVLFCSKVIDNYNKIIGGHEVVTDLTAHSSTSNNQLLKVQHQATRRGFQIFYDRLCKTKEDDPMWQNIVSPYNLNALGSSFRGPTLNSNRTDSEHQRAARSLRPDEAVSSGSYPMTHIYNQIPPTLDNKRQRKTNPHEDQPRLRQSTVPPANYASTRVGRLLTQPSRVRRAMQRADPTAIDLTTDMSPPSRPRPNPRKRHTDSDSENWTPGPKRRRAPTAYMGDRLSREIPSFDCSHAVAAVGRPSPTRAIRPTREEHLSVVATIEDDWYRVSRASGFPTKRRKSRSRQTLGGAGDRGEQGVGRNVLGAPYHETEAKRLTTTQRVNKTVLEAQRRDAEAKQAATTEDDLLHALGSLDATDLRWLLENTAQDSGVFSEDQNVSGQSAGEDKSTMTAPDEQVLPFETLPKDNDVFSRNQNTGVQSRSAQSTIQHHNPTTITGQTVISNEISEQNCMPPASAHSKENLVAPRVSQPQRILGKEDVEEKDRAEEDWLGDYIETQFLDEDTGLLGP